MNFLNFLNFFTDCTKQDKPQKSVTCTPSYDRELSEINKVPLLDPTWRDSMRSPTNSPTSVCTFFDKEETTPLTRACEYIYTILTLYEIFNNVFTNYSVEAMLIFMSNYEFLLKRNNIKECEITTILDNIENEVSNNLNNVYSEKQSEDILLQYLLDISNAKHFRPGKERFTLYLKKDFNKRYLENRYKLVPQYQDANNVQKLFIRYITEINTLPWTTECKNTLPIDLYKLEYFARTEFFENGYPIEYEDLNKNRFRPISPSR